MANQIISTGTVQVNSSTLRLITDMSFSQTISGSNAVGKTENITTASYQGLDTASLSDIRWFAASNEDSTGSISIASDSSGTNQIAYLSPGDSFLMPWSGSRSLYAKAFNTTLSSSLLQYVITES